MGPQSLSLNDLRFVVVTQCGLEPGGRTAGVEFRAAVHLLVATPCLQVSLQEKNDQQSQMSFREAQSSIVFAHELHATPKEPIHR